jgi:hypothetical protein
MLDKSAEGEKDEKGKAAPDDDDGERMARVPLTFRLKSEAFWAYSLGLMERRKTSVNGRLNINSGCGPNLYGNENYNGGGGGIICLLNLEEGQIKGLVGRAKSRWLIKIIYENEKIDK